MHESFFASKAGLKLVFLELICLHLKKLTSKNTITSMDPCPCHASRNLVLALFRNVSLSVCLWLSDDKFRENNVVLTCPASYSYYSTNHNDGVEDYFNQTDNGEFKKHGKINVMHMLRFRSTEPCTKTRSACVDRSSKTTLNFSRHYIGFFRHFSQ